MRERIRGRNRRSFGFYKECGVQTFGNEQFVFYFRVCKHIRDFLFKEKKLQHSARPVFSPRPYCCLIKRRKFNGFAILY